MMPTRAIHVVMTTYGTWLPGDSRGHWSPLYDFYGVLVREGHQLNLPDRVTRGFAGDRLNEAAKVFSAEERGVLAESVGGHVSHRLFTPERNRYVVPVNAPPGQGQGYMKPRCHAAAIEETHVHLLLGAVAEDLDRYVGRLKGSTSSQLKALPHNRGRTHFWTAKFWRVFLFDNEAVENVAAYIANHNVRRGLGRHPYSWVTPM